jgi:transketolase
MHLTGYDLPLEEVKNFRQWGSKTPGHPEYEPDIGVECTTGPLGQGFAMGVGMAVAERYLAAQFNRDGFPIVDHHVFAIVSDGDLMEGVASEAASLAGRQGLGKLVYLYDDNNISIDGHTDITFTEDVEKRFMAYNWHVRVVKDGNDLEALDEAIKEAKAEKNKPSLIKVRTHIGFGSPRQDSPKAHGEPLGEENLRETKKRFGWDPELKFHIPEAASEEMRKVRTMGVEAEESWRSILAAFREKYPEQAQTFDRQIAGELPDDWFSDTPVFEAKDGPMATRSASGKCLNAMAPKVPALIGGSADLAPSNNTLIDDSPDHSSENPEGRNLRFGVREHAMGAALNGMALHGGIIPYGGTFLIFSDYMRPSIRLAALMSVHSIFIFTHDSIGLGEDGPTHQPVEHLPSLRAIPNLIVLRPADANETVAAWKVAMSVNRPVALVLTRQKLPVLEGSKAAHDMVARGAYVLADSQGPLDLIIIATGSEVHLAMEAKDILEKEGARTRVVSMPSWDLFASQSQDYRDQVLPPQTQKRIAIEAAATLGWRRWIGDGGRIIGVDRFGSSAPGPEVMKNYGFNVENLVEKAQGLLGDKK